MRNLSFAIIIFLLAASPTFAQKQMTDWDEEGLKGRVKTVRTEFARLSNVSGKWTEDQRTPSSADSYDLNGDLTHRDLYDYKGNPYQKSVYSYIDSDKVVKTEFIENSDDIPPPPGPPAASGAAKSNRDPRYTYKFKYKYDSQGRRVETVWYQNNGAVFARSVYEYDANGNRVKRTSYGGNGSLSYESSFLYDNKGNVKEATSHATAAADERYSYEYQFDSSGNWIRRASSKWVTRDGKSYFEPFGITYRTITYY